MKLRYLVIALLAYLGLQGFVPQKPALSDKKRLEEGAKLYAKYSCIGCHGKEGIGLGDLRLAYKKYTASQIEAYIKDPTKYGNAKMPAFNDIITPSDYPLLVEYIISLGKNAQAEK